MKIDPTIPPHASAGEQTKRFKHPGRFAKLLGQVSKKLHSYEGVEFESVFDSVCDSSAEGPRRSKTCGNMTVKESAKQQSVCSFCGSKQSSPKSSTSGRDLKNATLPQIKRIVFKGWQPIKKITYSASHCQEIPIKTIDNDSPSRQSTVATSSPLPPQSCSTSPSPPPSNPSPSFPKRYSDADDASERNAHADVATSRATNQPPQPFLLEVKLQKEERKEDQNFGKAVTKKRALDQSKERRSDGATSPSGPGSGRTEIESKQRASSQKEQREAELPAARPVASRGKQPPKERDSQHSGSGPVPMKSSPHNKAELTSTQLTQSTWYEAQGFSNLARASENDDASFLIELNAHDQVKSSGELATQGVSRPRCVENNSSPETRRDAPAPPTRVPATQPNKPSPTQTASQAQPSQPIPAMPAPSAEPDLHSEPSETSVQLLSRLLSRAAPVPVQHKKSMPKAKVQASCVAKALTKTMGTHAEEAADPQKPQNHREPQDSGKPGELVTPAAAIVRESVVYFSPHERKMLKNYFKIHDVDGSGQLSLTELLLVIDDMDRTPKMPEDENAMKTLFENFDIDHSGGLDFAEFLNLMEFYYSSVYSRIFHAHDYDKSGSISTIELAQVSKELMKSGFFADSAEAQNLFFVRVVDADSNGNLSFDEFCHLMEQYRSLEFQHLESSAGFSVNQLDFLQRMFDGADEDKSGALDLKEVVKLLEKSLLGESLSDPPVLDEFVELFARMDTDWSATLDFPEFLRLLRVWDKKGTRQCRPRKDSEFNHTNALTAQDPKVTQDPQGVDRHSLQDSSGQQNFDSTGESDPPKSPKRTSTNSHQHQLHHCNSASDEVAGFCDDPQRQRMKRVKTEVICDNAENRIISKRQGLSLEETEALRENFVFSDSDASGYICDLELQVILKNCGCEPTTKIQKASIEACLAVFQSNGETQLDFMDIVSLVVNYNDHCVNACKDQFSVMMEERAFFPIDRMVVIFYSIGQYISRARIDQLLLDIGVARETLGEHVPEDLFKKMLETLRIQRLSEWRSTYGFKEKRLRRFRKTFDEHCGPETNLMSLHIVPDVARASGFAREDFEGGNVALERLNASLQGKDKISWNQFLLLLKHLDDGKMKQKIKGELEVGQQMGLDKESFFQIRKVFQGYDDHGTGVVSKSGIRSLFSTMGVAKTQEQRRVLRNALDSIPGEGLDLAQFLRTLHHLEVT